jgi:crotonobetainyl-CoA:carnitine CoA-transferase CaiB-like acyl-CoA transferase
MVVEVQHPVAGSLKMAGCPVKLSESPAAWLRRPSPLLGEHTEEVLSERLGLGEAELAKLRQDGTV